MDFEELDVVKQDLKVLTRQIAHTLQTELKTLKLKATRCALKCFQQKANFREAIACERTCQSSVQHMKTFMDSKTVPIHNRLERCLNAAEGSLEGRPLKDSAMEVSISCYEQFKKELAQAQNDIVLEFSYFD